MKKINIKKIDIKKIEIEKTKKVLNKFLLFITKYAFSVCLIIFLLCLMIGTLLFYKYYILVQKTEPVLSNEAGLLNEEVYQNVLDVWLEYEETVQQVNFKEYKNPFLKVVPEVID